MRRDNKAFRERFLRWKAGELVYEAGLPKYYIGKDGDDVYTPNGKYTVDDAVEKYERLLLILNDALERFAYKSEMFPKYSELTIPFDEKKRLVLSNAGLATGAVISENLLDTIAKYAAIEKLPLKTAIGLATKESTLGNPTDDKSVYKLISKDKALMFNRGGSGQHLNRTGADVDARQLVNYYKDLWNPYEEAIKAAKIKVLGFNDPFVKPFYGGKEQLDEYNRLKSLIDSVLISTERYADKKAEKIKNSVTGNILQLSFRDYKNDPRNYNPGQKNYEQLVNKRGEEVMMSPEVLRWFNKMPKYKYGKDDEPTDAIRGKKLEYHPEEDYYYGGTPFRITVTKHKKKEKPYWVTARTPQLTASEVMKGVDAATGPLLHLMQPSQYVGAFRDAVNGKNPLTSMLRGNSGVVSEEYAAEHPLVSTALNLGTDLAIPIGTASRNYYQSRTLGKAKVPENFNNFTPTTRTKVGDVEIDNPILLYHLDRGNGVGAFSNQGAYVKNGFLFPGTPKDASTTPYSWWNKGKPYATHVGEQQLTRLMTATEDTPGMLHVRSQNYPIGQWNGKRGFVINSEYVNPEGVNVSGSTYTLDPNYGWRKLTEDIPTKEWTDAVTPRTLVNRSRNIMDDIWK